MDSVKHRIQKILETQERTPEFHARRLKIWRYLQKMKNDAVMNPINAPGGVVDAEGAIRMISDAYKKDPEGVLNVAAEVIKVKGGILEILEKLGIQPPVITKAAKFR